MNFIPDNIRSQLAPGWSGINIALVVVLMIFFMPLGLAMIAYILLGESLGLDLGRPETFNAAFDRIGRSINAGVAEFNGQPNAQPDEATAAQATTTPVAGDPVDAADASQLQREAQNIQTDRETLQAERRRFEAEKAAFYQQREQNKNQG